MMMSPAVSVRRGHTRRSRATSSKVWMSKHPMVFQKLGINFLKDLLHRAKENEYFSSSYLAVVKSIDCFVILRENTGNSCRKSEILEQRKYRALTTVAYLLRAPEMRNTA